MCGCVCQTKNAICLLFAAARDQLTQIEYKRATHAVTEIERSIQSRDILKEGKYREFGKLITESHYSLRYMVLNLKAMHSFIIKILSNQR